MRRRRTALALLAVATVLPGCRRGSGASSGQGGGTAQQMVDSGAFDQAIAQLEGATDPEALFQLGRAWAGKARTAPLPMVMAGAAPPFKPEELRAAEAFERVIAARPDHAGAQLALAGLLAPHALAAARAPRPTAVAAAAAAGPAAPEATVDGVLRRYGAAIQADPAGAEAPEALIRFASAAGRLAEADSAYQELLRRRREDPTLLVRYGDFLAGPRGQPEAALAQYAQALMWRSDDEATRRKVVEIHLRIAGDHLGQQEYAMAEAQLAEARRAGVQPASAEEARLRELEAALREVRGR
ncbi:MAG TPA: hypothetical protein VEQ10_02050 [Vicinamibacteria bacterium]|nr:hypothetical protein [Vicinamibacteria bacterium]